MQTSTNYIKRTLLGGSVATTALIVPNSYDPISFPKSFFLTLFVSIALVSFVWRGSIISISRRSSIEVVIFSFWILLALNLVMNHEAFGQRIFGVSGRAIGFITLTSCSMLMLLSKKLELQSHEILVYLLSANLIVSAFFILQKMGFSLGNFQEYYPVPSSTLGNPNFVSGFIGFSALSALVLLTKGKPGIKNRGAIILIMAIQLWVILETASIQGIVALGVSVSVFILSSLYSRRRYFWPTLGSLFVLQVIALVGFFGFGPAAKVFSSTTVFSRLDYWRAAISMTLDSPFQGKGLDAFGENYRIFRDDTAYERFGPNQVSDSAHNIYLDMFAYGGIPLGVTYIALNLVPVFFLLTRFVNEKRVKLEDRIVLSLWFGFQVQALISPNQIGVFVWIWVILGAISRMSRTDDASVKSNVEFRKSKWLVQKRALSSIACLIIVTLAFLPVRNNIDFLKQANKADGNGLREVVLRFPQDSKLISLVAQGFQNSGYSKESAEIAKAGLEYNPNNFELWKLLEGNEEISVTERARVRSQLLRLEPRMTFTRS